MRATNQGGPEGSQETVVMGRRVLEQSGQWIGGGRAIALGIGAFFGVPRGAYALVVKVWTPTSDPSSPSTNTTASPLSAKVDQPVDRVTQSRPAA